MNFKPLLLICALGLAPVPVFAESVRLPVPILETQIAQMPVAPDAFAAELRDHLPLAKITPMTDGRIEIGYTGPVSPGFQMFLAENAPSIQPFGLLPGAPVSLSMMLSPVGGGTELRLMTQSQYDPQKVSVFETAFGTALPEGAKVLSQEGVPDTCTNMLVYQDTTDVTATQANLQALLDAQGVPHVDNADGTGTLLMGETPKCGIFVYIQPDPEAPTHSLVVVRLMEK